MWTDAAQDVLDLWINRRRGSRTAYSVWARSYTGVEARAHLLWDPILQEPSAARHFRIRQDYLDFVGQHLARALLHGEILRVAENFVKSWMLAPEREPRIRLRIVPEELYPLPWERIVEFPPFTAIPGSVQLLRVPERTSPLVAVPLELPIDVLIADTDPDAPIFFTRTYWWDSLRYFRRTTAGGVDRPRLRGLLRERAFDIVHLRTRGVLDARQMSDLLRPTSTRLLILHADGAYFEPTLHLAHKLGNAGGPAVLVVSFTGPGLEPETFFRNLYFGLVHDYPLGSALGARIREIQTALICPAGGEDLLRISSVAPRLTARGQADLEALNIIEHTLDSMIAGLPESAPLQPYVALMASLANSAREIRPHIESARITGLIYEREKGGMIPLLEASEVLARVEGELAHLWRYTARVVNTGFFQGEEPVAQDRSLVAGARYSFRMQIGPPVVWSHVRDPRSLPEETLRPHYSDEGLELRVVLFSRDFVLERNEAPLLLPEPPFTSTVLDFSVTAPRRLGDARLRAGVYYRQNLLQSLLITASITHETRDGLQPGNQAEVEFALVEDLRGFEDYPERTLNLATNESPDGTHVFEVVGRTLRRELVLDAHTVAAAVTLARSELQEVCSTLKTRGRPKRYRFPKNRGSRGQFVEDLPRLAAAGAVLFQAMVNDNEGFENDLRDALGRSATIQIAALRSAKYVFPWALVYDKPLVRGNETVCPHFLADLGAGGSAGYLENQRCFASGCQHADDATVVCPSEFWGFKHILEQPLSVQRSEDRMPSSSSRTQPVILASGRVSMVMGVSQKLLHVNSHVKALQQMDRLNLDRGWAGKMEIGQQLARKDVHIVYFYCHGGRTKRNEAFLGVGRGEGTQDQIFATDLRGWKVDWETIHPLVFINGCGTVDLTPDDLVTFNQSFSHCRAAGVIGTEISIPEELAQHFALAFFSDFVARVKVGKLLRRQRLRLLEKYNPLGLVYTPYCSAELELVVQ